MTCFYLNIADFKIKVSSSKNLRSLPYNYHPFLVDESDNAEALMEIEICSGDIDLSSCNQIGTFDDLGYKQVVYERNSGGYVFSIYDTDGTLAAMMESDACFVHNRVFFICQTEAAMTFGFNNTFMIAFAFSSAYKDTLMMHSSVIKKGDWGYMFLGKSGTGKSTHSSLWLKHVAKTVLLNDDNPVLRIVDGKVIVYGSPWSGKTPCYKQDKANVGALVMLEQKPYNKISRESVVVALSSLMCSCSIMIWDKASYAQLMNTMSKVISLVGVYHLECLPDKDAAMLSYNTISKE